MLGLGKNIINVLVLEGVINAGSRKGITFKNLKPLIDKAFIGKKVKAVALLINSPGGSASQSEIIASYIKSKSLQTKIPVISLVEDLAASGGYFIAVSGKEIYALSQSSIVGSIGVIYSGFGLEDFIGKYGIKRRIHTAGKSKAILDTFSQEKPQDVEFLKQILHEVHDHFKAFINNNRKNITLPHEELFSGKFWLASTALNYGLIDGITNNYEELLKEKFGKNLKFKIIKPKKGFLGSLFRAELGAGVAEEVVSLLESRSGIKALS